MEIFNKLYISGTLSINDSTRNSVLLNVNTKDYDQTSFRIRNYYYNLTQSYVGNVFTVAGIGITGYSGDNDLATNAKLYQPTAVAFDSYNNMYICDTNNHVIRKIDKNTNIITTIAGIGSPTFSGDGATASLAGLNTPTGIAIDSSDNIYIADSANFKVRKITNTTKIISTIYTDTIMSRTIYGISIDISNNLYIVLYEAASFPNQVLKLDAGTYISSVIAGGGFSTAENVLATSALLLNAYSCCVDKNFNIYIADQGHNKVRKITATSSKINTVAGNGLSSFSGDFKSAILAALKKPIAVAVDSNYDLYISDRDNNRIRKVNQYNNISTVIGTGLTAYSNQTKIPLSISLNTPYGITFDKNNDIYVCDTFNNVIRKLTNQLDRSEFSNNLFSIDGDNTININGNILFKDINFTTQSYATNSNLLSNVNGFVLHDGTKVNSPWFNREEFSATGSAFWMEPGYSKSWNTYSLLGDTIKLNGNVTYSTGSIITYSVFFGNGVAGNTYSDIYTVSLSNNGVAYYPSITKYYFSNRIDIGIVTIGTHSSVSIFGKNLSYYTVLTS